LLSHRATNKCTQVVESAPVATVVNGAVTAALLLGAFFAGTVLPAGAAFFATPFLVAAFFCNSSTGKREGRISHVGGPPRS